MINRPLLACMERVFSSRTIDTRQNIDIDDVWEKEVRTPFNLLPMAEVDFNTEVYPILVTFDASLLASDVIRTSVSQAFARSLWYRAQAARCITKLASNHELLIVKLLANAYPWSKVLSHQWLKDKHINGLEVAAAVLALEAAIRAGVHNQKLIMLTESVSAEYDESVGRFCRTRRITKRTIIISEYPRTSSQICCSCFSARHQSRSGYVKSANNPADKHTRL